MSALVIVILMLVFGGIGYAIGNGKGHGPLGAVLGALLGIIGIIIIAVMAPAPSHYNQPSGSGNDRPKY